MPLFSAYGIQLRPVLIPPRASGSARTLNLELVDSYCQLIRGNCALTNPLATSKTRFCRESLFFQVPRDIIAKYAAAPRTQRASPTHARPVHSAITESGHLSVDQRTFSASAKRSYVFGVARTSHLTALAFPTFRSHAHFGPFTDGGVRSPRRARVFENRVPGDRRRSTQQLAKPQDEASERRPRARVHQRYAVFAPRLGCVSRLGSNIQFSPTPVPVRNAALTMCANVTRAPQ